jgi:hypothetical protein
MVNLFASSEVSCGFEPRLGQSKDYYIGIKHAASESKIKDKWARNQNNKSDTFTI